MALISEDREFRTTRQSAPRDSAQTDYAEYLKSPSWRRRRNEAIRAAGYACQRCGDRKAQLQVHHLTYERRGAEWASDLEVLCRACHEGEHHAQDQREHAGIYYRVVSVALQEGRFTSFADLLDAVKDACSKLKIPYRAEQIWNAVRELDAKRKGILDAPEMPKFVAPPVRDDRPLTRQECADIMQRLNIKIGVREMPRAATLEPGAVDKFRQDCGLWTR